MTKYGKIIEIKRSIYKDRDDGKLKDVNSGRIYPFTVGRMKYKLGDKVQYEPMPGTPAPGLQKPVKQVRILD